MLLSALNLVAAVYLAIRLWQRGAGLAGLAGRAG
jgi:hypothetical protein